jgi:Rap1a immunity proteins
MVSKEGVSTVRVVVVVIVASLSILAALAVPAASANGDKTTGNAMYASCMNDMNRAQTGDWYGQGVCAGIINAALYLAPNICPPQGVTNGQAEMVTMRYIQQHPESIQQQLSYIAQAALQAAWPCQGYR